MFKNTDHLHSDEIKLSLTYTSEAWPEKGWLPAYYFDICLLDGTAIGTCDLRLGHNERSYIGGNIGYGVKRKYRGHRYAAKACKLLFGLAQEHGMDYLIITCDINNIASIRTCEICGGEFLGIEDVPLDDNSFVWLGKKNRIYRFDLTQEVYCPALGN